MSILVNAPFPIKDNHYLGDSSVAYQLIRTARTGAQDSAPIKSWVADSALSKRPPDWSALQELSASPTPEAGPAQALQGSPAQESHGMPRDEHCLPIG